MKKLLLIYVCLFAGLMHLVACGQAVRKGEGNKTSVSPTVAAFSAIGITGPISAIITVREGAPTVKLNGYANLLSHIKTKVENNTLLIYSDDDDEWITDGDNGTTAEITIPSLTSLSLNGAPDAAIHGNITGNTFQLSVSGAGEVTIDNIQTENFGTDISGAGKVTVKSGTVKRATYEVSGAGDIIAFPLQTSEVTAAFSGAGSGELTASTTLTAIISGAGNIKYKGHPAIKKDISGIGTIIDAN